jgi:hypothetical protein
MGPKRATLRSKGKGKAPTSAPGPSESSPGSSNRV